MNKEKTTSTDIEEVRQKFYSKFQKHKIFGKGAWGYDLDDIWNFFAPHLSNKSELKKEAVREFAKWYNNMLIDYKVKYKGVQLIISDNIVGQFLSSNEKEESENQ